MREEFLVQNPNATLNSPLGVYHQYLVPFRKLSVSLGVTIRRSPSSATPAGGYSSFVMLDPPPKARAWITYSPYMACAVCRDIGSIVAWMTGGGMRANRGNIPKDHTQKTSRSYPSAATDRYPK